jgi:hypothetical protein
MIQPPWSKSEFKSSEKEKRTANNDSADQHPPIDDEEMATASGYQSL